MAATCTIWVATAMAGGEEDIASADDPGSEAARGGRGLPRRGRGRGTEVAATAEIGALGRAAVAAAQRHEVSSSSTC